MLQHRSASKSEFLSKGVEEINSMRNSWKEDIKKELDAFKKLEMVSAVKVCGCGCVLTGGGIQYMCSLDRLPYDRGP